MEKCKYFHTFTYTFSSQELDFKRHMLWSLFRDQWVKVESYCSLCWYWWNDWPSLFKFLFKAFYGQCALLIRFTDSDYPFGIFKLFVLTLWHTCTNHLHNRIISLRREVWAHKTGLTPSLFIEVYVPSHWPPIFSNRVSSLKMTIPLRKSKAKWSN